MEAGLIKSSLNIVLDAIALKHAWTLSLHCRLRTHLIRRMPFPDKETYKNTLAFDLFRKRYEIGGPVALNLVCHWVCHRTKAAGSPFSCARGRREGHGPGLPDLETHSNRVLNILKPRIFKIVSPVCLLAGVQWL